MSWFDEIDESLLEQADKEDAQRGADFEQFEAGVYNMTIDKAYLVKSENGATGLELELVEDNPDAPGLGGRHLFQTYWIKSGNAKGNKWTYTDKDGKERPLPSWVQVNRLLKVCGKKLEQLNPKPVTIERFGKQEEVGILEPLNGCKVKAVVRPYENEYNGEIKLRTDVIDFLNVDGTSVSEGGRDEGQWMKFLSKNPVKKLKNAPKKEEPKIDPDVNAALNGW